MDSLQSRGEKLATLVPTVGCGVWRFERTGRAQFATLFAHGLNPWSRMLDVGCGALCGGYWLLHFLDPGRYHGIEPNERMLQAGIATLLEPGLLDAKRPRFDHGTDFDFGVFGERFDFVHAHSIWTHASKQQILRMLDGFAKHGADRAVFLASFKAPIPIFRPDYRGSEWVGASHESDDPGIVRHSFSWISRECAARGLRVRRAERIHRQRYLRIEKGPFTS